jgi:hypothetical protein
VFATKKFTKGEFLLEYPGELILPEDAAKKPDQTYIYFFQCGSNTYA